MLRKHPRILFLHWSPRAYLPANEFTEVAEPLFPRIMLGGAKRWEQMKHFTPEPGAAPSPGLDFIEVTGPVSDDVVPIIFGLDHPGVYVRRDVADLLRPHLRASQHLTPVRCDGETIPYFTLTDAAPEVESPEPGRRSACADRAEAAAFADEYTMTSRIFPDAFIESHSVHFVGDCGQLFLDTTLWLALRRAIPSVAHWLDASHILVDSSVDAPHVEPEPSLSTAAPVPAKKMSRRESYLRAQALTTVTIDGRPYERLRFEADETEDKIEQRGDYLCGHCEVTDFSYHLLGCEAERCPRCRGQIISCECPIAERFGQTSGG